MRGARPFLTVVRTGEECIPWSATCLAKRDVRRYHFTEEGRAHYVEHALAQREFNPDIDAPEISPANRGSSSRGGPLHVRCYDTFSGRDFPYRSHAACFEIPSASPICDQEWSR
ncbi:hypothetical protein F610DRAFT_06965 [Streptomyces sp. LaPpAH-199]|nr:hypothetical protein F610DRAFT_06965 [Streptomyces sp. LaPpAH-199]